MQIKLKLRTLSAYFSPNKVLLADNEDLKIELMDKGQLTQKVVLFCNGKTYVADSDKTFTLPRNELGNANFFELSERKADTDEVINRFVVENLYVVPCAVGDAGNRLIAERTFYQETMEELLEQVKLQSEQLAKLEKRCADLENGKFTMLKFGGNKQ